MRQFFLANQPDFEKLAQMVCEDVAANRLTEGVVVMRDFTEKGLEGMPSDRKEEYQLLRVKLGLSGGVACGSGGAVFYTQLNTLWSGGRRGSLRLPPKQEKLTTLVDDIDDRMPMGATAVYARLTDRWYLLRDIR
jgi:hypothetical protein